MEPIRDVETIKSLAHVNPEFRDYENEIYKIIASTGALLKGHFVLLSGKHSDYFMRFNNICKHSDNVVFIAKAIVSKIDFEFDAIISPDTAGILLAHEVAKITNRTRITASTDEKNMPTDLINFIDLKEGAKVLVVNDMTTTTDGLRKLIALVKKYKATPIGIALFATRGKNEKPEIDSLANEVGRLIAMVDLDVASHEYLGSSECKICVDSNYLDKPVESWKLN